LGEVSEDVSKVRDEDETDEALIVLVVDLLKSLRDFGLEEVIVFEYKFDIRELGFIRFQLRLRSLESIKNVSVATFNK
jgi:hypothetical protein